MIQSTVEQIFALIGNQKLIEVTETQLEIGFRTLKQKLDENNIDYRSEIFGLSPVNKELDDFNQFAQDAQQAQTINREKFISKINEILSDDLMAKQIALGCIQLSGAN